MGCLMFGWMLAPALLVVAIVGNSLRSARQIRRGQRASPQPAQDQEVIEVAYVVLTEDAENDAQS